MAENQYEITTTAQVERTYRVTGSDEDQARERLRIHLRDASLLRDGIVTPLPDRQKDTSGQRIKATVAPAGTDG